MQKNDMSLAIALKVGALLDPFLDQAVYAFSSADVECHKRKH
ncbi:hypothetical protein [Domibacillus robiginosus]|nr:hypothetical protein [Domibacillus robiginosus]